MLGHDVTAAAARAGHDVTSLSRRELDVRDAAAVREIVAAARPDAVLNCAAWTDVDGAEASEADALAVNGAGAAVELTRGRTADLGRPAPRPAYSVLRSERTDTPVLPPWQDGLNAYLELGVTA